MITTLQPLAASLEELFTKQVPPLPAGGKKTLVHYLPWVALVLAILNTYSAWTLWHWAHSYGNGLFNYANSLRMTYGGVLIPLHHLDLAVWLSMAVLLGEAYLYLAAFTAVRDRQKAGWDLLFYAVLLNVAYGVITLFSDYGSFGNLFGTIIGSAIGLYLLFQIRPSYLKPVVTTKSKTTPKDTTK